MGNEEAAGENFLPCTENSNRIQCKHKEIEMFDGNPYFFKVMVGDFAQRLRIPPAFAQKVRGEIGMRRNGVLQGPKGLRWNIKLCSSSTKIEFLGRGWENFVHQHAIEFGDFLVFKYICRICFRVRIFGKNGCEKNIPIFHSHKIQTDYDSQKRCPDLTANGSAILTSSDHLMNRKLPVDLKRKSTADAENKVKKAKRSSHSHPSDSPEHFNPSATRKELQTVKSTKTKTERRKNGKSYYVSARRPVNEVEKKKALGAANSFVSENPFDLITMKPSMVSRLFRLRISNAFVDNLKLPRERTDVTLVDPNKREWPTRFLGDLPRTFEIGRWRRFSTRNNLEEGDVCVFERVDDSKNKIKLNVHIFPVVKDRSPYYKRTKAGQVYDSLATTTNLYNKKIKVLRNEFATNLPAKAFGPEQGKCVKQGIGQLQGEKEKPSNGNKCINLDKSKCKPSISERKAACRRSLRLAQACHLAKRPKKKLWDGRNVVILL